MRLPRRFAPSNDRVFLLPLRAFAPSLRSWRYDLKNLRATLCHLCEPLRSLTVSNKATIPNEVAAFAGMTVFYYFPL